MYFNFKHSSITIKDDVLEIMLHVFHETILVTGDFLFFFLFLYNTFYWIYFFILFVRSFVFSYVNMLHVGILNNCVRIFEAIVDPR